MGRGRRDQKIIVPTSNVAPLSAELRLTTRRLIGPLFIQALIDGAIDAVDCEHIFEAWRNALADADERRSGHFKLRCR